MLRVPDEKYRDKVFKSMQEHLTTLKRETGRLPDWDEMIAPLVQRFERVLGPLEAKELPAAVQEQIKALKPQFQSTEWLYKKGKREDGRNVKIATGVNVIRRVHKAPGGLIRATVEVEHDRFQYVSLSGDFFCYPRDAISELESALVGTPCAQARDVLDRFYTTRDVETPGVTVDDWAKALPARAIRNRTC